MFEIILQLHGSKGSKTTVQSYQPTAEEKRLQQQAADYADAVAPNALKLNDIAMGLLQDSLGTIQVDYNKLNQNAQQQIAQAQQGVAGLTQGVLPAEYQANMENSIRSGVENTMGNALNSLANRGVLNSSVTNTAMNDISKNVSDVMAQQYSNNIGTLNGLFGQQASLAGQATTNAAAAQEAAQAPALNLWQSSLGLNSGGTGVALNAVSGQGTSTSTQNVGGSALSNIGSGLFGAAMNGLGGAWATNWCFADDTMISTIDGDKKISDVYAGDVVYGIDENGNEVEDEVIATMEPKHSDVYDVVVEKNDAKTIVTTTLSQPFKLSDGSYKDVETLRVGEKLYDGSKVIGVNYNDHKLIYDLELKKNDNYYANGLVVKSAFKE